MVEESAFRGIITFLDSIGIYDVVLPFLLIFVVVYAILEKTKVFGQEEIEGAKYTRKNVNAMVAFVSAFIVVASSRLVSLINEAIGNVVILLLVSISFLLLIGSFYWESEDVFLEGGWRYLFMIVMFIGVVLIFLHAVPRADGQPWLEWFWDEVNDNWGTNWISALIFFIIIIVIIMYVVKGETPKKKSAEK